MPLGLGFGELIFMLVVVGAPVALLVAAAMWISRTVGSGRSGALAVENQRLTSELEQALLRIERLEEQVRRLDSKASFTRKLPEQPRAEP